MPGSAPELPPVRVSTLGIWSTNDHYLDGERTEKSGAYVEAPWRYEAIEGASNRIPLDAPDRHPALLHSDLPAKDLWSRPCPRVPGGREARSSPTPWRGSVDVA